MVLLMNSKQILEQEIKDDLNSLLLESGLSDYSSIEPITPEASNRRYYRINLNQKNPSRIILCVYYPISENDFKDFLNITEYLSRNSIPVPKILAMNVKGIILLEDAGESDLSELLKEKSLNRNQNEIWVLLSKSIDILLEIHALKAEPPVSNRFFDFEKLYSEIIFFQKKLETICGDLSLKSPLSSDYLSLLKKTCRNLNVSSPVVFTHRDFHCRNIICRSVASKKIEMSIIDFQDARMGLPWYDLTSLLFDPYTDIPPLLIERGFNYYVNKSQNNLNECHNLFYDQALQRIVKAIGTYLFLSFEKKIVSYFSCISPALDRIEKICINGDHSELCLSFTDEFRRILLPMRKGLSKKL